MNITCDQVIMNRVAFIQQQQVDAVKCESAMCESLASVMVLKLNNEVLFCKICTIDLFPFSSLNGIEFNILMNLGNLLTLNCYPPLILSLRLLAWEV